MLILDVPTRAITRERQIYAAYKIPRESPMHRVQEGLLDLYEGDINAVAVIRENTITHTTALGDFYDIGLLLPLGLLLRLTDEPERAHILLERMRATAHDQMYDWDSTAVSYLLFAQMLLGHDEDAVYTFEHMKARRLPLMQAVGGLSVARLAGDGAAAVQAAQGVAAVAKKERCMYSDFTGWWLLAEECLRQAAALSGTIPTGLKEI
ncbi:MAG: hypothetical protein ACK5MT_07580 [Actinomycetales bacterium]